METFTKQDFDSMMKLAKADLHYKYLKLQQWALPKNRAFPRYFTKPVNEANKYGFQSTVEIKTDEDGTVIDVTGCVGVSKREAENDAATKMLEKLQDLKLSDGDTKKRVRKVLLIDHDNVQVPLHVIKANQHVHYKAFVSRTSSQSYKYMQNLENCVIYLTNPVGKDAADINMGFRAQSIQSSYDTSVKFAVASRDHFAVILTQLMGETHDTSLLCNLDEIKSWLKK